MTHIYQMTEWESNGMWLCGDVSSPGRDSNKWWYVPNILNISPVEYIYLLKDKFHAKNIHYQVKYDVLLFSFSSLEECRKFKNYVNKAARVVKFTNY